MIRQALKYIRNTNGRATRANFIEDHAPIGQELWRDFVQMGWVVERDGGIFLTPKGELELAP